MTSSDSQLVQILKRVERLREEPSDEGVPFVDASPLRTMQRGLEKLLLEQQLDEEERVIAYVLRCLVDDIFYNLTGDVPADDEISKAQVQFLRQVTRRCETIRLDLERGDPAGAISSVSKLTGRFFAVVQEVNRLPTD